MNALKLKERLDTQDNRCTSDPIFLVQQRVRIYGIASDYSDESIWVDENQDEVSHEEVEESGEGDQFQQIYYEDRWEFMQPFLTEFAAQEYIDGNRHRLTEPRIYVVSGCRNSEWIQIRNYFKNVQADNRITDGKTTIQYSPPEEISENGCWICFNDLHIYAAESILELCEIVTKELGQDKHLAM